MLDEGHAPSIVERLRAASEDMALSASARAQAAVLAERLSSGVRVVFFGPKGSGKSTLCNVMTGVTLPDRTTQKTRFFCADAGRDRELPWPEPVTRVPLAQNALVPAQFIDPALKEGRDAMDDFGQTATGAADVVLWCTQDFRPDEARIWKSAPDPLKDHSFLVLTKADQLAAKGILADRISTLEGVVEEEFFGLFPTTIQPVMAYPEGGLSIPDTKLAASGIKALADALSGVVSSGQRADLDSALLFLERQGLTLDMPYLSKSKVAKGSAKQHTPRAFAAAREKIMARALDLAEIGFDAPGGDVEEVLELCGEIAEELVDFLQDEQETEPAIAPWCEEVELASNKITLMCMESDARSAADAVTILLQLRRDLEAISVP